VRQFSLLICLFSLHSTPHYSTVVRPRHLRQSTIRPATTARSSTNHLNSPASLSRKPAHPHYRSNPDFPHPLVPSPQHIHAIKLLSPSTLAPHRCHRNLWPWPWPLAALWPLARNGSRLPSPSYSCSQQQLHRTTSPTSPTMRYPSACSVVVAPFILSTVLCSTSLSLPRRPIQLYTVQYSTGAALLHFTEWIARCARFGLAGEGLRRGED
jgi:hypothetical protein